MKSLIIKIAHWLYRDGAESTGAVGIALGEHYVQKFYPVGGRLFVLFDAVDDGLENMLVRSSTPEESAYQINQQVLKAYNELLPTILQNLAAYFHDSEETFRETIYVGGGIGGCLAVLVATQSPPHGIVTFGMPDFCSEELFQVIADKDEERAVRMAEAEFYPELPPRPPIELWNIQNVYEDNGRRVLNSPYDTLGHIFWTDRNGVGRLNPPNLRVWWNEVRTRRLVQENVNDYAIPYFD